MTDNRINSTNCDFCDKKRNIQQFIDNDFYDVLFGKRSLSRGLNDTDRALLDHVERLAVSPAYLASRAPGLLKALSQSELPQHFQE